MQSLTSLGHRAELTWAEPVVHGYHDVGLPANILIKLVQQYPSFRNRRGYCCTNARVERSFMLEGLAGQAASTGPRTGSCCCSCCRSAISVGEARWPDPLELPHCRWSSVVRSPSNCLSAGQLRYTVPVPPDSSSTLSAGASRQLLYTVCRCPQTAPLHCLLVSMWLFLFPILLASARLVGERGGELREAGWKHEWRVTTESEVAITFICRPTNQETV